MLFIAYYSLLSLVFVVNLIERIAQQATVQQALASFTDRQADIVELAIAVQQIPAPTFGEAARATFVSQRFAALGLVDVYEDDLHNVYGRYPSPSPSQAPVVVSAHMDTVFPLDTNLQIRRNGRYIYGPGLADNSLGVAGVLTLAQTLITYEISLPADVWFVANIAEEGLGNLQGMRAVVDRFQEEASYIVIEGGVYGYLSHEAIGVRRFQVTVEAPGGHSWGNFGAPNAIHILARFVTAVDRLSIPTKPRTTYNIGVIEGGTSVNTIAPRASCQLDLRSEDTSTLSQLVSSVERIVSQLQRQFGSKDDVTITMTPIGNRPSGTIPRRTPLVSWAANALQYVGCSSIAYMAGSTDANIPLSRNIPAVCVGLTESGNAHRLDEYINPEFLPQGMGQLLLLVLAAAGMTKN